MPSGLRVVFMGTPDLACASLNALMEDPSLDVVGVVTQPDRPKGRDLRLAPSPVKELALRRGLVVLQPERARDEKFIEAIRHIGPDLIAVAAYGQILPAGLLEVPRFGCLNVHTSLLPKYRGAGPIQWSILNDDRETGVTIMKMDAGMDTGSILSVERTPILEQDDAITLHNRLAELGARLLAQTIKRYVSGEISPTPQPLEGVSRARKISKADGLIDWTRPARHIWNQTRALIPWPGAFTHLPQARLSLLKIWRSEVATCSGSPGEVIAAEKTGLIVSCGAESLRVLELQREGSRRLGPEEFLAGYPLRKGERFASQALT